MLPALVLFRPLWTEPARARCISVSGFPNTFWSECYRVPCFFMPLRDADSHQRKPKKMSRRIQFRNYPKDQNPHYILLLWHNTGRTFLPQGSARRSVRFWAGERGNALTPHDRGGRHKVL